MQGAIIGDVPAWLPLILAAHRMQLRGVRRKSPSW